MDAGDTVVDGLLHLMEQARQDVLIISPYFVPGAAMMELFARMRARGVRIRVLTNSLASNDAPAAHAGYARYRKDLLAHGRRAVRDARRPGGRRPAAWAPARRPRLRQRPAAPRAAASRASLHSKAVIIDNRLAVIGSMNLDLRSQRKNSEVALLIRSAGFAQEAARPDRSHDGAGRLPRSNWTTDDLLWRAPPGAAFKDADSEPEASAKLKLLVKLIAPFAPDEML